MESTGASPRRRRPTLAAALVAAYLMAVAVAVPVHGVLAMPKWLALHLLVLGAASNAVFVYSRHFAQALLHTSPGSERPAHAQLVVLNLGAVAARLDGCGPTQVYLRIILPLMAPVLVATAVLTFIWTWDDFLSQLVYLDDAGQYTVPLALRAFLDSSGPSSWGQMLAMATLSLLPMLLFFLVFQRRITEGIATTGLRG